jgi:hypothetical protein
VKDNKETGIFTMVFRVVFWDSTHLWNVGRQSFYTAVHPRRQLWTSYPPPWELEISQVPWWPLRYRNRTDGYQRFGDTYCFYLQGNFETNLSFSSLLWLDDGFERSTWRKAVIPYQIRETGSPMRQAGD